MHHIAEIKVSPKKGETLTTRWLVVQSAPFPDLHSDCGGHVLNWRNGGELFRSPSSSYGWAGPTIGESFRAYMLAEGVTPPEPWNRTHLAGYAEKHDSAPNPGTIVFRGKDLGETFVEWSNPNAYPTWRVRGFDSPTDCERQFLSGFVFPSLSAFVAENKASLRSDAIAGLEKRFAVMLDAARKAIGALEQEASVVLQILRKC